MDDSVCQDSVRMAILNCEGRELLWENVTVGCGRGEEGAGDGSCSC